MELSVSIDRKAADCGCLERQKTLALLETWSEAKRIDRAPTNHAKKFRTQHAFPIGKCSA